MTAQEIFDTVWAKMTAQGRPAKDDMGRCHYRGPEGTACAVGCLLTDEEALATKTIFDGNVSANGLKGAGLLPARMADHVDLLRRLQAVHDCADVDNWLADFQRSARDVAARHNLTVPA